MNNFDLFEYIEPDSSESKVRNFKVVPCTRDEIVGFVEHWHYSKNINGIISDYCFKLIDKNVMIWRKRK
jgi:hypothetical protein